MKLASAPEAAAAQRDVGAAQDGERLLKDFQYVTQKVAQALNKGWPNGS
jgi:hypothetical protein